MHPGLQRTGPKAEEEAEEEEEEEEEEPHTYTKCHHQVMVMKLIRPHKTVGKMQAIPNVEKCIHLQHVPIQYNCTINSVPSPHLLKILLQSVH